MENYLSEICKTCKLPFNEVLNDYKITQISNKAILINNYIKILDYSDCKISLKVKGNILTILGSKLYISQINKNEILVKGTIDACGVGVKNYEK